MKMSESKFTRRAWFTLALVVLLLIWSVVGVLYFFTLPTDGWLAKAPDTFGTAGYIYLQNLMGASSGVQPNDHLVAIQSQVLRSDENDLSNLSAQWQVGNSMHYTVERAHQTLELVVPLVQWQWLPALIYFARQSADGGALGQLAFFAVAALAFYKRPRDHAAQALILFAAFLVFLIVLVQFTTSSALSEIFTPLGAMGLVTIVAAFTVLLPPTLLRLALVFPRPKPIIVRHPRLEYLPYLIGVFIIPLFLLTDGLAGYVWTIASVVGAIALLIHSAFTMRDALSRGQLLWGVWGVIIALLLFLATYLAVFGIVSGALADALGYLNGFSFSVMGIALGIAILRYRLFDIGIIIRRTVTYAIVVALLLIVYFGSVILLQLVFAQLFPNLAKSEIVTVLSTLAIAALFVPLRNRIQDAIDRRFNRKKYNAQKVLEDFSKTLRDETDIDKLTAELVNVVQETMQPRSVSVWLKKVE